MAEFDVSIALLIFITLFDLGLNLYRLKLERKKTKDQSEKTQIDIQKSQVDMGKTSFELMFKIFDILREQFNYELDFQKPEKLFKEFDDFKKLVEKYQHLNKEREKKDKSN